VGRHSDGAHTTTFVPTCLVHVPVYSANPILGDLALRIYTTETFDEDLGAIALAHTASADHGDLTLETAAEDHGPLYL